LHLFFKSPSLTDLNNAHSSAFAVASETAKNHHSRASRNHPPSPSRFVLELISATPSTPIKISLSDSNMTTTQPGPSPAFQGPAKVMKIKTIPLYGILVTQKSLFLGLRSLRQQCYAGHLAHKIAGARLPAELCEEIGAQLSTLFLQGAERIWKRTKDDPDARVEKFMGLEFEFDTRSALTGSEQAFLDKFYKLTEVDVAEGQVKLVGATVNIDAPGTEAKGQTYIHLSAGLKNTSVSMLVPGLAAHSSGPSVALANRAVTVSNEPASGNELSMESVRIRCNNAGEVNRLVQLDDVGACIRGWNQEIMKTFVEQLSLDVVTARRGGTWWRNGASTEVVAAVDLEMSGQ
jgi:hypothetical protein